MKKFDRNFWKYYCINIMKQNPENWNESKYPKSSPMLAEYWTTNGIEKIFEGYLTKLIGYKICFEAGYPENEAKFDIYNNPRKDDFFIFTSDKNTIIPIEAKATEEWEKLYLTFSKEYSKARDEKIENPNSKSKMIERCENLRDKYFLGNIKEIKDITYQILIWFAGALSYAKTNNSENIIMICQQFNVDESATKSNRRQLSKFVKIMKSKLINNKVSILKRKYEINQYGWNNKFSTIGPIKNDYTKGKNLYIIFLECIKN